MHKQDLIDDVAATTNSTKAEAGKAVDAVFAAVAYPLASAAISIL